MPHFAVGIYMDALDNGQLRLTLDDLQTPEGDRQAWKKRCLFTYIDVDEHGARNFQLERDVYVSIGEAVMARLVALDATKPRDKGEASKSLSGD